MLAYWLAVYPLPFLEFYKEWLFVVCVAACSLALRVPRLGMRSPATALVLAGVAILAVLFVQAVFVDNLWSRAVLMACYVGFFLFTLLVGRQIGQARDEKGGLVLLSWLLLAAALGTCFFAALQLNWIEFQIPLVARRPGNHRVTGNLAQSNHLAALLWLGSVGAIYLGARGRLRPPVMVAAVFILQLFAQFSGSRMPWLYAALLVILGGGLRLHAKDETVKKMSAGLLLLAALFVVSAWCVSASGALKTFGLESGAERISSGSAAGSDHKRLWFWMSGVSAALDSPFLGVGVGRYVGHSYKLTMSTTDSPSAGAEAHAHNLFLHLAAELGLPVSLFVAVCLAVWWVAVLRRAATEAESLAVLALCSLILIHANLEYPLWYTYFLGVFGLVAAQLPTGGSLQQVETRAWGRMAVRTGAVAVLLGAAIAYLQFGHLALAMRRVVMQVELGAAPQRDPMLERTLAELPSWSPYRDYAESILLMTALPTKLNAAELAARCDRAVMWGPSPYLLSRCATVHQVAGNPARASHFANSVCKIFPRSDLTLIQSMTYVGRTRPEAEEITSLCVERQK